MALNPITLGLRRFVNDSNDITRVELRVPPGAELEVDEVVAMQLPGTFKDPAVVAERDAARLPRKAKRAKPADDVELDAEAEPVE